MVEEFVADWTRSVKVSPGLHRGRIYWDQKKKRMTQVHFKQLLASESTNGVLSPMIGDCLIPGSDQNFGQEAGGEVTPVLIRHLSSIEGFPPPEVAGAMGFLHTIHLNENPRLQKRSCCRNWKIPSFTSAVKTHDSVKITTLL